ncbi:hypothetical protein AMJ40_02900 [candidate division TA06 bacterium DG_26]|uniref:Outer membrane lipoprotein BamD-like domain-containing protein n=1 Tax=candidate division TA06 bacterium DG_26 TaxID=1703771 RepID=A0A0S7WK94_UNCT6|nr:MAG: hypothetical protein AMJ40_02900 [candidate division TA06 bacterium DG_26]
MFFIVLLCVTISCAYYNTFYNAKRSYREAQVAGKNRDQLLDKCIEKCAKVIEFHPKSRWVDDAIFLMGKCFFEKREYTIARRKFEELLNYFPDSPFADDATLYLGRAHLGEGEYVLALDTFRKLTDSRLKCDALFYVAEAHYALEEYERAARAYQDLLRSCPKSPYREEVLETLAASLLNIAEYARAIELYQSLLKGKLSEPERLEISLRISDAYLDLEEPDRACEILLTIDEEIQGEQAKAEVRVKLSECYRRLGEVDAALRALDEASELAPKSEVSARSFYQQGLIYEEEYLDFAKAREAYEKASAEYKAAEASKDAERRLTIYDTIETLRGKLLEEDGVDYAETQFSLAEIYLLELEKPDVAIEEYTKAAEQYPESEYRPKAIYAIAWIYENLKADTVTAEAYLTALIEEYPATEYAQKAREILESNDGSD